MSRKRVLSVGNCRPDHQAIARMIQSRFDAEVVPATRLDDALSHLRDVAFDLVLVNRKLDCDYSDGLEIIRSIKADDDLNTTPVMLLSNFPEYQRSAVDVGAEPGFGKSELDQTTTHERLAVFLG